MTLTEAAYWTRRLGILGIGGLVILVVTIMIIFNITQPDPLPEFLKADYACTLIGEEFKQQQLSIPTLELGVGSEKIYQIDTATGRLPELPRIAYVYKYSNPGPSLTAQSDAKDLAKSLGLKPESIILRGGISYEWPEDEFGRTLSVEVATMNYTFKTNFARTDAYPIGLTLPTDTEAKNTASAFLRSSGSLFEDYAKGEIRVTYINIMPNGSYTEAKSRSEAELVRVDFYRNAPFLSVREDIAGADEISTELEKRYKDYQTDTTDILGENGRIKVFNFNTNVLNLDTQKSNISVYVGPADKRKKDTTYTNLYGIDYTGWVIDAEPCGTYDLISATEVTTIIENGNASLVYLNELNGDTVVPYTPRTVKKFTVNNVFVAYLDLQQEQEFMQPVYVVVGEASLSTGIAGKFYYYIPAINYNVIQDRIIKEPAEVVEDNSLL